MRGGLAKGHLSGADANSMTSPDHDHRMTNFRGGLLSFGEVGCPRVAIVEDDPAPVDE